jgi:hypothetical protein
VLSGIYVRRNIPAANGKELSLTMDKICPEYFNGYNTKGKKKGKGRVVPGGWRYSSTCS